MDDDIITADDLAEAQARWADPSHEGAVAELFSTPAYGHGFRGDNPILEKTKNYAEQSPSPVSDGEQLASWYAGLLNDLLATQTNTDDLIQGADEELEGTGWGLDQDDDTGIWEPRREGRSGNPRTYGERDWTPYTGPRGGKGWEKAGRIVYGAKKPGSRERREPAAPGESGEPPTTANSSGRTRGHLEERLAQHARDLTPAERASSVRTLGQLRRHHGDEGVVERIHQITDDVERGLRKLDKSNMPAEQKQELRQKFQQRLAQLHSAANAHSPAEHPSLDMASLDDPGAGPSPRSGADADDAQGRADRGRLLHAQNAANRQRRDAGQSPVGDDRHYGARTQTPSAAAAPTAEVTKEASPSSAPAASVSASPSPAIHLPPETPDQTANRNEASRMLGKEVTREVFADLTGESQNPGGKNIRNYIEVYHNGDVEFNGFDAGSAGSNEGFNTTVTVHKGADGKIHCHYGYIRTDERNHTLAPRILAGQLKSLRSIGVNKIEANAARTDGYGGLIGYKVWPKLGMDGPIPGAKKASWPTEFKQAKTIQELYNTPGGKDFWEEHGFSINLGIDLQSPQAEKMFRLADRMASRGVRQHAEPVADDQYTDVDLDELVKQINMMYPKTPEEWEKIKKEQEAKEAK